MSNTIAFSRRRYPMATTTIANGDQVGLITGGGAGSGYAQSGAHITTLRMKGVAVAFYDINGNKLGPATNPVAGVNAGAPGAMFVEVQLSIDKNGGVKSFPMANDAGGTPLTQADCGGKCYALDGKTVTGASSGNSVAGEVDRLNSDGTVNVLYPISY